MQNKWLSIPLCITDEDGTKYWVLNDEIHRVDGPAIELNDGSKVWVNNDRFHRVDGPAVEWKCGYVEYWIDGNLLTEQEFKEQTCKISG